MEKKYNVFIKENGTSGWCPNCGGRNVRFIQITAVEKASGEALRGVDKAELNCCKQCAIEKRYGPSGFLAHYDLHEKNSDLHVL